MKKKLSDKIIELKTPKSDEYFVYLEKALEKYHDMISSGLLLPRGNNISISMSSLEKSNFSKK